MLKDTMKITYNLDKINGQTNEAIFVLRKADGEAVGKMILLHRKVVDQSERMGSLGYIKNPKPEQFPGKFIISKPLVGS